MYHLTSHEIRLFIFYAPSCVLLYKGLKGAASIPTDDLIDRRAGLLICGTSWRPAYIGVELITHYTEPEAAVDIVVVHLITNRIE